MIKSSVSAYRLFYKIPLFTSSFNKNALRFQVLFWFIDFSFLRIEHIGNKFRRTSRLFKPEKYIYKTRNWLVRQG